MNPLFTPKHTKGTWRIANKDPRKIVSGSTLICRATLANGRGEKSEEEAQANARLITASPEGYSLAKLIVSLAKQEELSTHVEVTFDPEDAARVLNAAEAFIAKAEGRP